MALNASTTSGVAHMAATAGKRSFESSEPIASQDAERLQAQKVQADGPATSSIAHELNNVLTVVMGNAERIALRATPEIRALAESVVNGGARAAQLTQQLLTSQRRQSAALLPLDPNVALDGMEPMLRRVVGDGTALRFALAARRPVQVDRSQLESAILALAINAADAMPRAARQFTISTDDVQIGGGASTMRAGWYVRITVSDNGTGVPADVAARAFEPFSTTKGRGKGTGLGLSMVLAFAQRSGGHAQLNSELGAGTTVSLFLPQAEVGAAVSAEPAVQSRGETVVLVEGDPMIRDLVTTQLESLGYTVAAFADGDAALAATPHGRDVDVLVTAFVLPGSMNGREIAGRFAATHPNLRVLFASGLAREAIESQGVLPPGARLLRKPFHRTDLAATLREVLAGAPYRAAAMGAL